MTWHFKREGGDVRSGRMVRTNEREICGIVLHHVGRDPTARSTGSHTAVTVLYLLLKTTVVPYHTFSVNQVHAVQAVELIVAVRLFGGQVSLLLL
ncbi:Hypothetical predicted protein [Prunus dulcis]|uniref:Uncharacterized protein n=1 Tax=Prunus dulcis TaxID=3755 RepID=A0A5E4G8T0_PRUDU|nr:hypothetical protein L3X38_013851 [Prunus dulcis]VVA35952.1 Hypothetical predicted protein [Prunus dulcis]